MDRRAGSNTSDSKVLKELEAEITCLVCQGHYTDAKLLPCMHYYCKSCIEELRSKCSAGKSFPCPECREDTFLPSGGVDSLKSAFFVERLKDLFAKMSTEEGQTEIPCGVCKGKSTLFCRECAVFYCSGGCLTSHSEEHHLINLERRETGGSSVDPRPVCPEHGDHVSVYCFTCETSVCRDCIISGHSSHRFNSLKNCALEKRREICNLLIPLHKSQNEILDAEKKVCETEKDIEKQSLSVFQSIHDTFSELKSLLEEKEAELASLATALVKEKKDALEGQKRELEVAGTEIRSVVDFAESVVESVSDKEMMESFADLQKQMLDTGKRHCQLKLEPLASADMAYNRPPPSIIPDSIGSLSCVPDVTQTTISTKEREQSSVTVQVTADCFRPSILQYNSTSNVQEVSRMTLQIGPQQAITSLELKSKSSSPPSTVTPTAVAKGNGVFEVTYTPVVRGRHDLVVKVDCQDISGSPFRVLANIHPCQLKNPVLNIEGIVQPMAITLNHNKQLVVAEYGKARLAILTRAGALVRTVEPEYSYFKAPRGVAAGPEGTFFVTCNDRETYNSCCLLKLDYFGHTLKALALKDPFGVKEIQGRMYVCVHEKVEILDVVHCNRIGRLTADILKKPYDIAAGRDYLYVVNNSKNGFIAKFSLDGQYRGLFQQGLPSPRYICVNAAGFVFVTLGRVPPYMLVFNEAGDRVASFGQEREWLQHYLSGIAVDEDGFIYSCVNVNNRVVVF